MHPYQALAAKIGCIATRPLRYEAELSPACAAAAIERVIGQRLQPVA